VNAVMNKNIRIGIGYDLHRLVKDRELFLGGVRIPFSKGILGHSDADVLMHSICDALLGACACGDIGVHFPDTDPQFKDISGSELVKRTFAIIQNKTGVRIINVDTVLICDKPNISAYRHKIKESISTLLDVNIDCVNVKAKTTENTDTDTISSYAAVLLEFGQ
jgi:2-C-methyl-D-erythritol 2,4-cyclodiphosphate synthase